MLFIVFAQYVNLLVCVPFFFFFFLNDPPPPDIYPLPPPHPLPISPPLQHQRLPRRQLPPRGRSKRRPRQPAHCRPQRDIQQHQLGLQHRSNEQVSSHVRLKIGRAHV